jgi:GMP synthase (glutamine-hydrolysing)
MHIGILQCGHIMPEVRARHGDYSDRFEHLFAGRGWQFTVWNVVDMDFPEAPGVVDAWLLTGSPHGAYDALPFIAPLEDFLRRAAQQKVPMAGICFGHQIIAQALGGKVEKFSGGWGIGPTSYRIEGLGEVTLNAWHQDQVVQIPPGARPIADTDFCGLAGLVYDAPILTLQPHPEFDAAVTGSYLEFRMENPAYPPGMLRAVQGRLGTPLDNGRVADWIADFLAGAVADRHRSAEVPAHG